MKQRWQSPSMAVVDIHGIDCYHIVHSPGRPDEPASDAWWDGWVWAMNTYDYLLRRSQ